MAQIIYDYVGNNILVGYHLDKFGYRLYLWKEGMKMEDGYVRWSVKHNPKELEEYCKQVSTGLKGLGNKLKRYIYE